MTPASSALDRSLAAWDAHFAACGDCLRDGERLCYEGEYLTESVVGAREALRLSDARSERGGLLRMLHHPSLVGVPA